MVLVNLTSLDFDQIKQSIKDYIRSNSNFTDYDFEGSNLSMIIDTLAYNTYITAYNTNMVTNEVFIDSATLRENVVSLARNIGYVPVSRTAPKSEVLFTVDTSSFTSNFPVTAKLKAGEVCTSNGTGSNNFIFSIPEDITVPVDEDGIASFDDVILYEGSFLKETFTVSSANLDRRYILGASGIDTKTIRVRVRPTQQSNTVFEYRLSSNLNDINSFPRVYFIQEVEDERYEIIFGDGIFGQKLEDQNFIEISYITTNGADGNGVTGFNYIGQLESDTGASLNRYVSPVITSVSAYGGSGIESVESIKKYAPRVYASQNRAVTADDYETLIPSKIYPETESISVFGGEELNPPQYGKVFISIKPRFGDFLPNLIKENIKLKLKKYAISGIVPELLDLKYLFVEISANIYYNTNLAPSAADVSTRVQNNALTYSNSTELNKYGARFKYSKFLKIIDDSHESITSNITLVRMRRDLRVVPNAFAEYQIGFGNRMHISSFTGFNIKTTGFRVSSVQGVVYMSDIPNSDGLTGSLFMFTLPNAGSQNPTIVRTNVGRIDYVNGIIVINAVNILSGIEKDGQQVIEIQATPTSNDIVGLQDLYLQLDINNSSFEMISDQIASGIDPSASNYIVSSSYSGGSLIRAGEPSITTSDSVIDSLGTQTATFVGQGQQSTNAVSNTTSTSTTTTTGTTGTTGSTGSTGTSTPSSGGGGYSSGY